MVRRHVVRGHRKIVDLDLKTYFDTIPHDKLLALVKQRVRDPSILWLIRRWLKAGIMEQGTFYSSETGSPQGGVISPLLANIYLNAFDQIWHKSGLADGEHQAKLVRFADDSVICCRRSTSPDEPSFIKKLLLSRPKKHLDPPAFDVGAECLKRHIMTVTNDEIGASVGGWRLVVVVGFAVGGFLVFF
jgi:retron-type reverse transcriptase